MSSIPRPHRNCRAAACSANRYRDGLCRTHYDEAQAAKRAKDTRSRWVQRKPGEANPYATTEHKQWRAQVLERDTHTCQLCGATPGKGLHAHHLDHNPHNRTLRNGVTLCRRCHNGVEREYQRGRAGAYHHRLALAVAPPEGGFI